MQFASWWRVSKNSQSLREAILRPTVILLIPPHFGNGQPVSDPQSAHDRLENVPLKQELQ
jgi:hypothetical protein